MFEWIYEMITFHNHESIKGKRQSWDHNSKMKKEKFPRRTFNNDPLELKAIVLPMHYADSPAIVLVSVQSAEIC